MAPITISDLTTLARGMQHHHAYATRVLTHLFMPRSSPNAPSASTIKEGMAALQVRAGCPMDTNPFKCGDRGVVAFFVIMVIIGAVVVLALVATCALLCCCGCGRRRNEIDNAYRPQAQNYTRRNRQDVEMRALPARSQKRAVVEEPERAVTNGSKRTWNSGGTNAGMLAAMASSTAACSAAAAGGGGC